MGISIMSIEITRQLLRDALEIVVGPGNGWRTVALIFLVFNIKNLPFVWHFRFLNATLRHSLRPRLAPQPVLASQAFPLFLPVITSTRSPVLECDYNIHKSNSTYFTDIDVSRTHLLSLLCSPGLAAHKERRRTGEEKARVWPALGAVACFFLREIKPYEDYEMWTRVLCWDQKWVYVVTHFVKRGAVRPDGFVFQPSKWHWWPSWTEKAKGQIEMASEVEGRLNGADKKDIFAFAISKFVFKAGRRTVLPELVFERCGQLPPKPLGSDSGKPSSVEDFATAERSMASGTGSSNPGESLNDVIQSSLTPSQDDMSGWTWEMIEKERQRGMEIAGLMAGMDKLKAEFTGDSTPALGLYTDLLF